MKRNFILAFLFVLAVCGMKAQSLSVLAPEICRLNPSNSLVSKTLEGDGTTHYMYSKDFFAAPSNQQESDALFAINAQTSEVTQACITHPKNVEFIDAIENDDEVIAFYSVENGKESTITLYMNIIAKNQGNPAWNPTPLNVFPLDKKDNAHTYLSVSPDKSKVVLMYFSSVEKADFKGVEVMTFDNNGERIWNTALELDHAGREFQVLDLMITNDAEVFVPMVSYVVPGKNARTDEKLHIYDITADHINSRSESVTFGHISNGRLIQTRDGNLSLGGFYRTTLKDNENGSYMVKMDARYVTFINISSQGFPSTYKERSVSKSGVANVANQNHYVTADKLVEFDNGNVALIGEQRNISSVTDDKGITTYNYFAKNILFVTADENADIKEFKLFKKNQASSANTQSVEFEDLGLSYNLYFIDNKLYILFADNIDNLMGASGQQINMNMNNKHCTALMVVDELGESTTSLLINSKVAKGRMLTSLFMDDDAYVILFADKKSVSICKLSKE